MRHARLGVGFGFAGGVATGSTWDPANKGAGVVLSNGNKTASKTTSGWNSVLGTSSKSSGKYYFEYVIDARGTDPAHLLMGFALNDQNVNSFLGASGSAAYERMQSGNGNATSAFTYANNPPVYEDPETIVGTVFAWAIDGDAGKAWFAFDNTFGGDPAAGTGPDVTWTPPQTIFPALGLNGDSGTNTVTLRTFADDQAHSPPAGFTAWG